MNGNDLNPLILDKVKEVVDDVHVQEFIYNILETEREYGSKRGKISEYEKTLAKCVRGE